MCGFYWATLYILTNFQRYVAARYIGVWDGGKESIPPKMDNFGGRGGANVV